MITPVRVQDSSIRQDTAGKKKSSANSQQDCVKVETLINTEEEKVKEDKSDPVKKVPGIPPNEISNGKPASSSEIVKSEDCNQEATKNDVMRKDSNTKKNILETSLASPPMTCNSTPATTVKSLTVTTNMNMNTTTTGVTATNPVTTK